MRTYNQEQLEAIFCVRKGLRLFSSSAIADLKKRIEPYLSFRKEVDAFFLKHFVPVCTEKCFDNDMSGCCGKEGITTFFADVVINTLLSSEREIDILEDVLQVEDPKASRCVYLGEKGCLWKIKPIVCEMFLCLPAKDAVFGDRPALQQAWDDLKEKEKKFTWPSRPVLFEHIEHIFMKKGLNSSLMYFHNSPGLLRIRAQRRSAPQSTSAGNHDTKIVAKSQCTVP